MKGLEATQISQAAQIAELRKGSERVIRAWYENNILESSNSLADLEGRVELIERTIKRAEYAQEAAR